MWLCTHDGSAQTTLHIYLVTLRKKLLCTLIIALHKKCPRRRSGAAEAWTALGLASYTFGSHPSGCVILSARPREKHQLGILHVQ